MGSRRTRPFVRGNHGFTSLAGDTIDVTCTFNNTTAQAKRFGSNTEDEMCFFYAMAWPRGQLRNGATFSIVPGAEPEVNCIQ